MKIFILAAVITASLSMTSFPQSKKIESVFTELNHFKNKACESDTIGSFSTPAVFLLRCEGVGGYRLELISNGGSSSSLSLISPDGQKHKIDYFEDIGYGALIAGTVEWRVLREGKTLKPFALIVEFENIDNLERLDWVSYQSVIKLTVGSVCLTDAVRVMPAQQTKLRALADASARKPCLKSSQADSFLKKLEGEIPFLIDKLAAEDEKAPNLAARALVRVGSKSIEPLIESLKQKKLCEFQMLAADVLRQIDSKQEIIKTTLLAVAGRKCEYRYSPEKYLPDANFGAVMAQWRAATVLVMDIEGGIPLVTGLVKEKGGEYIGLRAFAELISSIIDKHNNKMAINPETIMDLRAAIPVFVGLYENPNNKLRCDYYRFLVWMQTSGFEELQGDANRALRGKESDCRE